LFHDKKQNRLFKDFQQFVTITNLIIIEQTLFEIVQQNLQKAVFKPDTPLSNCGTEIVCRKYPVHNRPGIC